MIIFLMKNNTRAILNADAGRDCYVCGGEGSLQGTPTLNVTSFSQITQILYDKCQIHRKSIHPPFKFDVNISNDVLFESKLQV